MHNFLPFSLASLSSLASRRERVSFVIQKKRNEIADPETGYAFKFYKMGKWVTFKGLNKPIKFPEMKVDFSR